MIEVKNTIVAFRAVRGASRPVDVTCRAQLELCMRSFIEVMRSFIEVMRSFIEARVGR